MKMFQLFLACLSIAAYGAPLRADDAKNVPCPAAHLVWDKANQVIYASVPASAAGAGSQANTLTILSPVTGSLVSSAFVGAEPDKMALSSSGKYLYIALNGANSVRVYNTVEHKLGPTIQLGAGVTVADLAPAPGSPDSIAVERQNRSGSPSEAGTVVLTPTGETRKSAINGGHSLVYDAISGLMFGFENEISSYGLRTMTADETGVLEVGYKEGIIVGNQHLSAAQNGLVYADTGAVIDPIAGQKIGQFPGHGYGSTIAADASHGRVFFLSGERRGAKIEVFDLHTFAPLGAINVPESGAPGSQLIRWGEDGLAFIAGGRVWMVASAQVGVKLPEVDLSVTATGMPDVLKLGATAVCTVTVTNRGPAAATGVTILDQLSPNLEVVNVSAKPGSATAASSVARAEVPDLAPGASAQMTVEVRLKPQDPNQDHPLISAWQNAVARSNENDTRPNNNHLVQISKLSSGGPAPALAGADLTGVWKSVTQLNEGAGADLQATIVGEFEVQNIGTEPAPASRMRFFVSDDRIYDPQFSQLLQEIAVPALQPGGVFKANLKARLAKGVDAIGFFVFAVVNTSNTVQESNKRNNIIVSPAIP